MKDEWEIELLKQNPPKDVRRRIELSILYSNKSKDDFLRTIESRVKECKERLCGIQYARKMLEKEERYCLAQIEKGTETLNWVKNLDD